LVIGVFFSFRRVLLFLFLVLLEQDLSLLLNLQDFFRGFQNALFDLFNVVQRFPLLHPYLPSKGARVYFVGSQQDV